MTSKKQEFRDYMIQCILDNTYIHCTVAGKHPCCVVTYNFVNSKADPDIRARALLGNACKVNLEKILETQKNEFLEKLLMGKKKQFKAYTNLICREIDMSSIL